MWVGIAAQRPQASTPLPFSGWKAPTAPPTPPFLSLGPSAYPYSWIWTNDGWFCEVLEAPQRPKLTSPTAGYTIRDYAPPNQTHWHPAAAHWACTCWHSAIGCVKDTFASDADHSGLVFWAFAESCQHPGNRGLTGVKDTEPEHMMIPSRTAAPAQLVNSSPVADSPTKPTWI